MPAMRKSPAKQAPGKPAAPKKPSTRSKTGNSACSQAASNWQLAIRGKAPLNPDTYATLGKCRAQARAAKSADDRADMGYNLSEQGRTALKGRLQKRFDQGLITQKSRQDRLKELLAQRKDAKTEGVKAILSDDSVKSLDKYAMLPKEDKSLTMFRGKDGRQFAVQGAFEAAIIERRNYIETGIPKRTEGRKQFIDALPKAQAANNQEAINFLNRSIMKMPSNNLRDRTSIEVLNRLRNNYTDLRTGQGTIPKTKQQAIFNEAVEKTRTQYGINQATKPATQQKPLSKEDYAAIAIGRGVDQARFNKDVNLIQERMGFPNRNPQLRQGDEFDKQMKDFGLAMGKAESKSIGARVFSPASGQVKRIVGFGYRTGAGKTVIVRRGKSEEELNITNFSATGMYPHQLLPNRGTEDRRKLITGRWDERRQRNSTTPATPPTPTAPAKTGGDSIQKSLEVPQKNRLKNEIVGPSGAKITGYNWSSHLEERYSQREDGLVSKRVSNWAGATKSEGTGRSIVHSFYVTHPGGKVTVEGIGSAQNILGISETRLKTIAKNEAEAQRYRSQQNISEVKAREAIAQPSYGEANRDLRIRLGNAPGAEQFYNDSTTYRKDGKFLRVKNTLSDAMQERGWQPYNRNERSNKAAQLLAERQSGNWIKQKKIEDQETESATKAMIGVKQNTRVFYQNLEGPDGMRPALAEVLKAGHSRVEQVYEISATKTGSLEKTVARAIKRMEQLHRKTGNPYSVVTKLDSQDVPKSVMVIQAPANFYESNIESRKAAYIQELERGSGKGFRLAHEQTLSKTPNIPAVTRTTFAGESPFTRRSDQPAPAPAPAKFSRGGQLAPGRGKDAPEYGQRVRNLREKIDNRVKDAYDELQKVNRAKNRDNSGTFTPKYIKLMARGEKAEQRFSRLSKSHSKLREIEKTATPEVFGYVRGSKTRSMAAQKLRKAKAEFAVLKKSEENANLEYKSDPLIRSGLHYEIGGNRKASQRAKSRASSQIDRKFIAWTNQLEKRNFAFNELLAARRQAKELTRLTNAAKR